MRAGKLEGYYKKRHYYGLHRVSREDVVHSLKIVAPSFGALTGSSFELTGVVLLIFLCLFISFDALKSYPN